MQKKTDLIRKVRKCNFCIKLSMKSCMLQWNIFSTSYNPVQNYHYNFRYSTETETHIDIEIKHLKKSI